MSMKFYYTPMTSATRVHWALEEVGVPYDKVKIDLAAGEQRTPEYLALNPNGRVPLLVVDDVPVFESLAILLYLGERYGVEKGLFPELGPKRAEAFKWMAWTNVTLGEQVTRLLRNTSDRFPAEEKNPKAAEGAKKEIADLLGMVDRALEGREYLVDDHFTLADLAIVAFLPFMARLGVDYGPFKNVQAWMGRCVSRPALARAMQG
jgi:glutathione S-transferase